MKYRIGFDIGIKSVGYAVVENDEITEQPIRIVDLGVRTFDANEVDKTGESTAKNRRILRGVRRRRRRKNYRFQRMTNLLNSAFSFDYNGRVEEVKDEDVYYLRAKALDERISNVELCKVVFNLLKRRGFKSNRKAVTQDKEEGKLKTAIAENQKYIKEHGYRTIGEAIYKDNKFSCKVAGRVVYNVRNHNGSYDNCFYRDDLNNELLLILKSQQTLGNNLITDELIEKASEIFTAQRNFDVGPGWNSPYKKENFEVGNCVFIETEKRAPKASLTFERFNALTKLNSLRINGENLDNEQFKILLNKIEGCVNIKFSQIRKWLNLDYSKIFNLCNYSIKGKLDENLTEQEIIDKMESKEFVKFDKTIEIRKALGVKNPLEYIDLFDEIALMLSLCKSDVKIDEYIASHNIFNNLTSEQLEKIKGLTFDKFGSISIKAMRQIIPYLQAGNTYDKACALAGFDHAKQTYGKLKFLKGKEIEERLKDITTPTVKRAVNQTLRILNEIIKKYGSPQFVTIELARDFGKSPNERKSVETAQLKRYEQNRSYEETIRKYKAKPTGMDYVKMQLYNEQDCKCMYSGEKIELDELFGDNYYQVDHAIPISRSLDDSFNNKVLVKTKENQNKGDLIPYEYFLKYKTPEDWNNYVVRVNTLKNVKKRKLLLTESFSEQRTTEFINRNSNDTSYISRTILNLMQDYLMTEPSKHYKKVIKSVSGGITSYLRKIWGINKIREDGDSHHCVDACVIAMATDSQVQALTNFNKFKEKYFDKEQYIVDKTNRTVINKSTGEIVDNVQLEQSQLEALKNAHSSLNKPYEHFVKELELRSMVKYDNSGYTDFEKEEFRGIGYIEEDIKTLKPLFISRMKSVKTSGAIHNETMLSTKIYDDTKMVIKAVSLDKLSISDKAEPVEIKGDLHPEKSIEGFYKPLDDRKLYLMLKESLIKDKECFKKTKEVYKPAKNGEQGMPVKKVKICYPKTDLAFINGGAFENSSMYRIDIFTKNNKYYVIPVYMKDVYAHKLPNKFVVSKKPWINLDDSYQFKFSLYQNDLVKIKWNKDINFSKVNENPNSNKPNKINLNEGLFYYNSFNINNNSIKILTSDRCYFKTGCGIQKLQSIEKYYVDIMGKVYKAKEEKRKEI